MEKEFAWSVVGFRGLGVGDRLLVGTRTVSPASSASTYLTHPSQLVWHPG